MRHLPRHTWAVLALGIISQLGQIVLLRELLMVFHGNELSIGIILAAWMTWVGIGSRFSGVLLDRCSRTAPLLALTSAGILAGLPATVLAIRSLRGFFDVTAGAHLTLVQMTVSSLVVTAPVCLLLGLQFVLLARIWRETETATDTRGAARTYIGEAAGNALGGLLFTFLLAQRLSSFHIAVAAGILMPAAVWWWTRPKADASDRMSTASRAAIALLVALPVLLWPLLGALDQWAHRLQWRLFSPEYRLVETRESRYGTIAVIQRGDQHSFFQSSQLLFSTSGRPEAASSLEEQEAAVFAHLSLVQHGNPQDILLLGGGLRGTLREITRHGVRSIDYVELDEELTSAARPYLPAGTLEALNDPRVKVQHMDGRVFVKSTERTYDMVIVDMPCPSTAALNRFYTEQFFREARARLNPGGVLVTSVASTADLRESAVANRNATLYHTLSRVFTHVLPAGERLLMYFATDTPGQVSVDVPVLEDRFQHRGIQTAAFSPRHFATILQDAQVRRVNWVLRHHGRDARAHLQPPAHGPLFPGPVDALAEAEKDLPPVYERYFINSDLKPIAYYYTLVFADMQTGPTRPSALRWLIHVQRWWIWPVLGAALVTAAVLRRAAVSQAPGFALHAAVFTTGLSTMTLQIVLLFAFQSIYGFVYEMVGLIVALFMGGLALGAAASQRWVHNKSSMMTLAIVQLLIAVFAAVIGASLHWSTGLDSARFVFAVFAMMTFGAGVLNGVDFPLATACCLRLRRNPDQSTGIIYGIELFGACAGALLASVVLAPVLGLVACCLLAALANAGACCILLLCGRNVAYG